jgi:hypothetical protein
MAICLAQDGSLEPLRLEAVPALYNVDSFRVGRERNRETARANSRERALTCLMVGRNRVEFDVDGGASRSNERKSRHRSRLISPKMSRMVRPG